jgi:hypothetical protein
MIEKFVILRIFNRALVGILSAFRERSTKQVSLTLRLSICGGTDAASLSSCLMFFVSSFAKYPLSSSTSANSSCDVSVWAGNLLRC